MNKMCAVVEAGGGDKGVNHHQSTVKFACENNLKINKKKMFSENNFRNLRLLKLLVFIRF